VQAANGKLQKAFYLQRAICNLLPRLFMHCVLLAERTMLLEFHARRVRLFIFGHRIIPALAIAAFEGDNFSHFIYSILNK
jgi:hypothetical protein